MELFGCPTVKLLRLLLQVRMTELRNFQQGHTGIQQGVDRLPRQRFVVMVSGLPLNLRVWEIFNFLALLEHEK